VNALAEVYAALSVLSSVTLVAVTVTACYRDMRSRDRTAWAYVTLLLLLPPLGLVAWLIDRQRFPRLVETPVSGRRRRRL